MIELLSKNYLGKICTILTPPVAVPLDARTHARYFTGKVVGVDKYGIWIEHPDVKTIAFFSYPITGIVEEERIAPGSQKYEEIKQHLEKQKTPSVVKKNSIISVDELTAKLKQVTKQT